MQCEASLSLSGLSQWFQILHCFRVFQYTRGERNGNQYLKGFFFLSVILVRLQQSTDNCRNMVCVIKSTVINIVEVDLQNSVLHNSMSNLSSVEVNMDLMIFFVCLFFHHGAFFYMMFNLLYSIIILNAKFSFFRPKVSPAQDFVSVSD